MDIDESRLSQMGTKPIGSALVHFFTNEDKDTLFIKSEWINSESNLPTPAIIKKLTQTLKGTYIEENIKDFVLQLLRNKKTDLFAILVATPAKHVIGRKCILNNDLTIVKNGDELGVLSNPEHGESGTNLFGQEIKPKTNKDLEFTYDESICIKNDQIIANQDGKLIYDEFNKTLMVSAPYKIVISDDQMEGFLTYLDNIPLTLELASKILKEYNIQHGILTDKIQEAVRLNQTERKPLRDFLIAKGTPVKETKQGQIVFSFEAKTHRSYEENTSGKIDYKTNNTITSVKKGERIAVIKPPKEGQPGKNVFGITVNHVALRPVILKPLKNVTCNQEQTEFFAEADGSPIYKHNTLQVVDVMQISGDLDLAIGNIDFEGSVNIEGDVGDDFTIKAGGDITIGGSVGTSKLYAGGKIIIGKGFNGKGIGLAECNGDFAVKFMKEVKINCESNVIIETEALNCHINALGMLIMVKSNLMGGEATIMSGVFIENIGSSLGIKTKITPGVNYLYSERKATFEKRLEAINLKAMDINNKIGPILNDKAKLALLPPEKKQVISHMVAELKKAKIEKDYIQAELTQFLEDNRLNKIYEIICYNKVYPGASVKIGHSQKEFKIELSGPILITEDIAGNSIKTGPIKTKHVKLLMPD